MYTSAKGSVARRPTSTLCLSILVNTCLHPSGDILCQRKNSIFICSSIDCESFLKLTLTVCVPAVVHWQGKMHFFGMFIKSFAVFLSLSSLSVPFSFAFFFVASFIAYSTLKGTYHLWISRFDFCHFWYSKTTILSKNKNAFKFKKFNLKAEI